MTDPHITLGPVTIDLSKVSLDDLRRIHDAVYAEVRRRVAERDQPKEAAADA